MKSTDITSRWKMPRATAAAGALAITMLTGMIAPAVAQGETTAPAAEGSYTEQVLAKNGDNAIDPVLGANYRIPALAHLGDGVVLASYDGRPYGGDAPQPNSILQRRSTDNGKTWGPATYVARGQMPGAGKLVYGFSDPSYVVDEESGDVFNFFVYSKDVSFQGSGFGNDDSDRSIISAAVAVSKDKGISWSMDPAHMPVLPPVDYAAGSEFASYEGPLITEIVKPVGSTVGSQQNVGGISGVFAASGQGIQLKYGEHKGRLVQQFTGKVKQADGSVPYQAYSLYSDDHGKTWERGAFVGTGMDENKSVELSNGDVMLNSRASSGGNGGRKIAISKDGGETYGPVTVDTKLTDPVNNASIARMYPDAAEGSDEAKMLLFSNANSSSGRQNGTIRYSCNDGATWSSGKQFKAGAMSYSTVTALGDGSFGVFYEGDSNTMTFGKFNAEWLDIECGVELTAQPATGDNGETVEAELTLTNNGKAAITDATASFNKQNAWTFGTVDFADVAVGSVATVRVPVTIPASAKAGTINVTAKVSYGTRELTAVVPVTITGGAEAMLGLDVVGSRTDTGRDLADNPYTVGEQVPYQFAVTSLSNVSSNVSPAAGNFAPFLPPAGGNCRWNNLSMWANYTCGTPRHAVTADELEDGFFLPVTTWDVASAGMETKSFTFTDAEVDLLKRNPSLALAITGGEVTDVDGDGFASSGDIVSYELTATNNGNVRLTNLSGIAVVQAADAEGTVVAVDESVVDTFEYVLDAADIAAASVRGVTVSASAFNGSKEATAVVEAAGMELNVKPEPTESESAKPEPTESESAKPEPTESESAKPTSKSSSSEAAGDKADGTKDPLAETGFNATAISLGGGMLLAFGALLVARTVRRARH